MENLSKSTPFSSDDDEIDLIELGRYYLSKLIFIVGAGLLGGIAAGLITWKCITPQYTATSKMYMVSSSSGSVVDLTDLDIGTSLSEDYVEMIRTRPIFKAVIKKLKLDYTYEELSDMVSLENISDTRILAISVTSTNPQEAADIANVLAETTKKKLPKLMETSTPTIAEEAIVPKEKSSPSYKKNIVIGAGGCMVIVLMILTIIFLTNDTLQTAEDVEKEFGIIPMAVIPEGKMNGSHRKDRAYYHKNIS